MSTNVRYSDLLPHEFRTRLAARPLAYLPLGTLEWHGEQMALGSDAIQSEGLMIEAAKRFGGIVVPPVHLGPDRSHLQDDGSHLIGMDTADVTTPNRQLDGSCYWAPRSLFMLMVDNILEQLKRAGFSAVFGDGHGPSRGSWCGEMAEREKRFGLTLLGVTREWQQKGWLSQMDHAGRNETSLMMHYRSDLVDLSQLDADRDVWPQGVGGEDPRDSTAEYGRECMEKSLEILEKKLAEKGV